MIQRVQSFYLFLTSLFYFLYWFFGKDWYLKGYENFEKNLGEIHSFFLSFTCVFPLLISIICFSTLLLFKKRLIQIKLSNLVLYMSGFLCLYTVFFFSVTLNFLSGIMPSQLMTLLLYAAVLNPFICTYLIFMTIKSIKKDEKLVSGEGLIR